MQEILIIKKEWYEVWKELPADLRTKMYSAIFEYAFEDIKPTDTVLGVMLNMIKEHVIQESEDYQNFLSKKEQELQEVVEKRERHLQKQRENGKKGGAPKGNKNASKTTQKQPKNNPKQPKTTQLKSGLFQGVENGKSYTSGALENTGRVKENNPKQPKVNFNEKNEEGVNARACDILLTSFDNNKLLSHYVSPDNINLSGEQKNNQTPLIDEEKKASKKGGVRKTKTNTLVHQCREKFEAFYKDKIGEDYYWSGKDGACMKRLLQKIKFSREKGGLPVEDSDLLDAFGKFLDALKDSWIVDRMDIATIDSKYNVLRNEIKNKKNGKKDNGYTNATATAADFEEFYK